MVQTGKMEPARRRGLADEAADRIRDAIFAGVYPSGTQLRELELSAALGMSRGPVREALLRLEREGLVRNGWHRGASVTELSACDVVEIDSLRGALEDLAVARVVIEASANDWDALADVVSRMERSHDEAEMVRCDIAFHDAMYVAARHERLAEAWRALCSQVHLFLLSRVRTSASRYLKHIPAEHKQLLKALRSGDVADARALFAEHRRHASEILARS